jgi:hypothetical protein
MAKGYVCPHCQHAGEEGTSPQDQQAALAHDSDGLARARALEEVAPLGDPNRQQAEAALAVYPGRALYAVTTLINKAGQLDLPGRQAVAMQALLLSALDSADNMWAHPEGRPRPKQLTPSPEFREENIWRSLERAVEAWAGDQPEVGISWWPEGGSMQPGSVAIYAGSVRQLSEELPALDQGALLTVPPRPNQAYWTLSALWAAWIWGRETADPLRVALRRRRYDWTWHANALRQTGRVLNEKVPKRIPFQLFIPEAEPGYLGACLAGFDAAGMQLEQRAFRLDDRQAQLTWTAGATSRFGWDWPRLEGELPVWMSEFLQKRGEPCHYYHLHFDAATNTAGERGFASLWSAHKEAPVSPFQRRVEGALAAPDRFLRLDQRQDPETGLYWLSLPEPAETLADRVERAVLQAFRKRNEWTFDELDAQICRQFPGVSTPDRTWVIACAQSYAEAAEGRNYQLRQEDRIEDRTQDLAEIRMGIRQLGEQMGYEPSGQDPIVWLEEDREVFAFCVMATAILSEGADEAGHDSLIYVLPGGRAALIAEKAKRDPRLANRLEAGLIIIKFRHIRRLLSDTTLTADNFLERLTIDPPEQNDPQLPLL